MTTNDPIQSALEKFREAWYSGDSPVPELFCRDHPECGPELREQIESFLMVARSLSEEKPGGDEGMGGRQLGEFKILGEIGRGGMGVVYEAEQVTLNRKVALKILPPHLSFSSDAVLKFRREAEAGGRQTHPGIVSVIGVGEHGGNHYIAQELVEGSRTLADQLKERKTGGALPVGYFREAAELIASVANALEHAHRSRVIHRDVKPSNILLTREGLPKITDFGLAKVEDALALSRSGDFAGTPFYMSPEQTACRRAGIDKRTDIFSLGVTLYEMMTLELPFQGETTQEVLKKILLMEPRDPRKVNHRVPRDLAVICLKAMEKDPVRRYQSMTEMYDDLYRFLHGEVILARPPRFSARLWKRMKRNPIMSGAVGMILLLILGFIGYVVLWSYPQIRTERDKAVTSRKEAEEHARIAEERYEEILRLSDVKRLADLETEAEYLWPPYPEKISDLQNWLKKTEALAANLDVHSSNLDALRQNALPYDSEARQKDRETHPEWDTLLALKETRDRLLKRIPSSKGVAGDIDGLENQVASLEEQIKELDVAISKRRTLEFRDMGSRWRHDTLQGLVSGLRRLCDEERGLMQSVEARLEFASKVHEESVDDHQETWRQAVASISDRNECPIYDGLIMQPQIGMVPLGRDPHSGLWEFAHLQSGELPERGPDGWLDLTDETGLVFVLIPGGTFDMGATPPTKERPSGTPNTDPFAESDERPVHSVSVRAFLLSKYEMTQAQWQRITGVNPSCYLPGYLPGSCPPESVVTLLNPVEQVSWTECALWFSRMKLRLPTEAEWEYAARAGTSTIWWTGNEKESLEGFANLCDLVCKIDEGATDGTYEEWLNDGCTVHAAVGRYAPNPFGMHDILGNVWEWCRDSYDFYEFAPSDGTSFESRTAIHRVYRGGGWNHGAKLCRSADRSGNVPGDMADALGCRPAASLE